MPLVDSAWYVDSSIGITVNDLGVASSIPGATVTLVISVPAGALICVAVNEATSIAAGTCADGTNGAYTLSSSVQLNAGTGILQIFHFFNSAALTSATITYTKNVSGRTALISAFYATGIQTSSDPLDAAVTATAQSASQTPTVTSGTPAVAGELIVGVYGSATAPGTQTQPANTAFNPPFTLVSSTLNIFGGHLNVNGTLPVVYNPTAGNAVNNALIVLGFKPAVTPSIGWYGVTAWAASASKVCGNLVRQNATPVIGAERVFVCVASTGGTGTTAATEPAWQTVAQCSRGVKITDNTVTWQEATGIAALNGDLTNTPTWNTVKNTAIVLGQVIQNVAGTLILICTTAGTAGNAAEPSWAAFTNAGATTADNTVTWTTLGASFSAWSAPHARFSACCTANWQQPGNSVYLASEHFEVSQVSLANTIIGGALPTTSFYSVNKSNVPPGSANLAAGATIATSASNLNIRGNASAYFYNLTLQAGTNPSSTGVFSITTPIDGASFTFKNCTFYCNSSGAGRPILGGLPSMVLLDSCTIIMSNNAGGDGFAGSGTNQSRIRIVNCTFTPTVITPTNLHLSGGEVFTIEDCDLSIWGAGKTLINSGGPLIEAVLSNCKLGAGVSIVGSFTATTFPGRVTLIRCDSGATNYRTERYDVYGSQVIETTIIRTGGASDGVTPISWKIVGTSGARWQMPYESIPITIWCDTTGSHTITVRGTTTGGGVPNDDDIWIDVDYLGSASFPQGTHLTTTKANALTASSAVNNSSDASTWGGAGAGNGFKIVSPAFTVNMKGYITVFVKVGKTSATYYIDPLAVLS
jgi:hypothetical protein